MKNILLVCAAGMSTSMLVKRMQEHAAASGIAVNINALAISEAKEKIKKNLHFYFFSLHFVIIPCLQARCSNKIQPL